MMSAMRSILHGMTGRMTVLILVCQMAFGWGASTLRAEEPVNTQPDQVMDMVVSDDALQPEGVEGIAVYYAKRFQGRRTNSGQIFDHDKLTAAHPSLPHGTKVKVMNLANGKSVVVTVNDRCRKRSYEIIDLTRKAAQELGFYGQGSAKVRIIPQ